MRPFGVPRQQPSHRLAVSRRFRITPQHHSKHALEQDIHLRESRAQVYYVSLYLKTRQCLLGTVHNNDVQLSESGMMTQECWYDLPILFPQVQLDLFIVMPNHLHGLLIINQKNSPATSDGSLVEQQLYHSTIEDIIKKFMFISSQFISEQESIGTDSIWRPQYEHEMLMNESRIDLIRDYISDNPEQWLQDPMHPSAKDENDFYEITNKYTQN